MVSGAGEQRRRQSLHLLPHMGSSMRRHTTVSTMVCTHGVHSQGCVRMLAVRPTHIVAHLIPEFARSSQFADLFLWRWERVVQT